MAAPSKDPTLAWSMLKASQNKTKLEMHNPTMPVSNDNIRFAVISDTHNKHKEMSIPSCDVLIHCGDFTLNGYRRSNIEAFDRYLGTLDIYMKVIIAGNHDSDMHKRNNQKPHQFENCKYLQDSSTTVFGYKIYGTPWIPLFHLGAFMLDRGEKLKEKWQMIPSDTDILVTHGPPVGYGDKTKLKSRAGDVDLLLEVQQRIKPIMHLFGHIHEGRGCWSDGTTTFINASMCDIHYKAFTEPFVFDLPVRENYPKNI